MSNVALQWHVAVVSGGDPLALGLLYFFNLVPLLVLTPFLGVWADSGSRQQIMVAAQAATGVLAVSLGVLLALDPRFSVVAVLGFAVALGVAMASAGPASQAMVADIVPRRALASALSLNSVSLNLCRMGGPAVAAPILALWGAAPAVLVYGVASLGSAVAIARLRIGRRVAERSEESVIRRIRAGAAYVRQQQPVGLVLLLVAATAGLGSTYVSMLPILTTDHYHRATGDFTYLVTGGAAGALIGSSLAGSGGRVHRLASVAVCVGAQAFALLGLALVREFSVAVILVFFIGALSFGALTACSVIVQSVVSDDMRGRVSSLYLLAWGGSVPVGALALAWYASSTSPATGIATCAGLCASVAFVVGLRARHARPGPAMPPKPPQPLA